MPTNDQGNLVPADMNAKPVVVETKVEPTIPSADKKLEEIKARVRAANPHLEDPNTPNLLKKPLATKVELVKPDDPTKPKEPGSDIKPDDKAVLSELAKAQSNYREAQQKLKDLEAKVGDSEYGAEIKKLWGGTDAEKLQVLGKLSGKDPTEALADLVEMFYNQDPASLGTSATAKPVGTGQPDPMKVVLDRLEAMSKTIEDLKQQPVKASQEQLVTGTKAFLKAQVSKLGLEISSRAENLDEAVDKALAKAPEVVKELGYDPAKLSPEQAEEVATKAIQAAEAEFEQLGKRFGKVQAQAKPSVYDKPITRAAPRLEVQAGDTKPVPFGRGWDEYRERVKNAWEVRKG